MKKEKRKKKELLYDTSISDIKFNKKNPRKDVENYKKGKKRKRKRGYCCN
jgi:hypothetical protein